MERSCRTCKKRHDYCCWATTNGFKVCYDYVRVGCAECNFCKEDYDYPHSEYKCYKQPQVVDVTERVLDRAMPCMYFESMYYKPGSFGW